MASTCGRRSSAQRRVRIGDAIYNTRWGDERRPRGAVGLLGDGHIGRGVELQDSVREYSGEERDGGGDPMPLRAAWEAAAGWEPAPHKKQQNRGDGDGTAR